MGLFSRKKDDKKDEKKADTSAKVDSVKKEEKKKQPEKKSMKDLYNNEDTKKAESKPSSAPSNAKALAGKKATDGKREETKKTDDKKSNAYRILVRPLITEKASIQGASNKYFFEVSRGANKIEIAKAIKDVYGVQATKVNIVRVGGKKVRSGRIMGKRKDWKKAIVTLREGESIKVYEGV